MSEIRTLDPADGHICEVHRSHEPHVMLLIEHHILPQSWGGLAPGNLVVVCPTGHYNIHKLLNEYVHAGKKPPWSVLQHYGVAERDLADRAWAQRPSDKPPFTIVAS